MNDAHVPMRVSRADRCRRLALLVATCLAFGACGVIGGASEYVVQVDSVAVAPPLPPSTSVRLTYHGFVGSNLCAELRRVERKALPGDTIQLRFIGRQEGGNCFQMPAPLRFVDSLPNQPARTIHLRVLQRGGLPLLYDVNFPLAARP